MLVSRTFRKSVKTPHYFSTEPGTLYDVFQVRINFRNVTRFEVHLGQVGVSKYHLEKVVDAYPGLNYYFYPTLILKLAYEFNNEREFIELDDDGFLAQLTLGF